MFVIGVGMYMLVGTNRYRSLKVLPGLFLFRTKVLLEAFLESELHIKLIFDATILFA